MDSMDDLARPAPIYRIRLQGVLDDSWSEWFGNMTLTVTKDGQTLLFGPVIDQPALHGLFKKCRNLGLPILLVEQVEPERGYPSDHSR